MLKALTEFSCNLPMLTCTCWLTTCCVHGGQVVQLFDSWAGYLSPSQYAQFSLPYAQQVIDGVRAQRPDTPLIFHANGGSVPASPGVA